MVCVEAADCRTFCTAGTSSAIRIEMMPITTRSSISVKPGRRRDMVRPPDGTGRANSSIPDRSNVPRGLGTFRISDDGYVGCEYPTHPSSQVGGQSTAPLRAQRLERRGELLVDPRNVAE